MIRKQIYITPAQEAKIKRLAQQAARSEAEIIREAIEAIPEENDPILSLLMEKGLVIKQENAFTKEESNRLHEQYLAMIGNRQFSLSRAILEERDKRCLFISILLR